MVKKKNEKLPRINESSGRLDEELVKITEEEINYELDDEQELENNSDLIKYEFNMIELPFFTKDKNVDSGKARRYTFSEKNQSYMRVIPAGDPELLSNKIPQEFDEKIFYGILKLSREQNSKEIITDYFTLAKAANVHYNHKERIKDAIQRLSRCTIELNNLFYSSILKQKVLGNKPFYILQHAHTYSLEKESTLPPEQRGKYKKYFRNSKITEILIISISDEMYRNIEHKGFLYFDHKALLEVNNATARKLFMLITKWQGWEKKPSIKRSCRFLASRIPLSWEKNTIRSTVDSLDKACMVLKKKDLIIDYVLNKTKPVRNSYIEFYFGVDKNDKVAGYNINASGVTTGHENMAIDGIEDEFLNNDQVSIFDNLEKDEKMKEIISHLPDRYKTSTNISVLKEYSHMGTEYCISSIQYAVRKHKENFNAYLMLTLKNNWAKGQIEQKKVVIENNLPDIEEELRKKDREHKENALKRIDGLTPEEYDAYALKAQTTAVYKMVYKEKIEKNMISWDDAIREVVLVLLSGE